jgi:hypothetical protein
LEYTDQQRAAFKEAYAKRFRKQLIMLVVLFAVMASLALTEDRDTFFGFSAAVPRPDHSRRYRCRLGDLCRPKLALPGLQHEPGSRLQPEALPQVRHHTAVARHRRLPPDQVTGDA